MLSFADAITRLRQAVDGGEPDFTLQLGATRAASGVPETEIPAYLPPALLALIEGPTNPLPIPNEEHGFAWLFAEVAPLIPSAQLIEENNSDGLAVSVLGRALLVRRGDEHWQVVAWPHSTSAAVRLLNTFAPTPEQVHAWAYDPELRFTEQDEDMAISRPEYLAQLIGLAADPACPKHNLLLAIADHIVTRPSPELRANVTCARDAARTACNQLLGTWADDLDRLLAYGAATGAVTASQAKAIAHLLLIGRHRPALILDRVDNGDWWQFIARWPEPEGRQCDALAVHAATGSLRWSAALYSATELAALVPASDRLANINAKRKDG